MSYYVYVNRGFSVKFSELDIQSSNNINYEEIDEKIGKKLAKNICRGEFGNKNIVDAFKTCSFSLYFEEEAKEEDLPDTGNIIKGIICVTNYNNSKYICVSEKRRGLGTELVTKLKQIAKKNVNEDKPVIVIYGMGLTNASSNLYIKNGFKNNEFVVKNDGGNKTKKRTKKTKKTKKRKMPYLKRFTRFQKKFV